MITNHKRLEQNFILLARLVITTLVMMPSQLFAKPNLAGKSAQLICGDRMKVYSFVVDATGNVSDSGRSIEGPACVQVYFPAVHYKASLSQVTTVSKGPDATSVVPGSGATSGAVPGE